MFFILSDRTEKHFSICYFLPHLTALNNILILQKPLSTHLIFILFPVCQAAGNKTHS